MRSIHLAATLLFAGLAVVPAAAAVVASSLPYTGTPDWTDATFPGTSMTTDGTRSVLQTEPGLGVWFGWGSGYADPAPAWSPGSNATGNSLALTASFSADTRDFNTYFHDGRRMADIEFAPTHCDSNVTQCFGATANPGVDLLFRDAVATNGQYGAHYDFVPLDLTQTNSFGFLLLGDTVTYVVNGARYSGIANPSTATILIIGDGSGSSPTGTGAMTITRVAFDNATQAVPGAVPEPATWGLMLGGFGLTGAALRRRSAAAATVAG